MSSKVPESGEHLAVVINSDLDPRVFGLPNLCRAAALHARIGWRQRASAGESERRLLHKTEPAAAVTKSKSGNTLKGSSDDQFFEIRRRGNISSL